MATHTQFHDESVDSANASGDAIDEYLHNPALQGASFAAAIATDAGYAQLRWITARAIENFAKTLRDVEIGQVIAALTEDKSMDWSEDITTLEAVERELAALRSKITIYETHLGPVEDAELRSRYARLGRFFAASLGASEDWDSASITSDGAALWNALGHPFPIGGQDTAALEHWRAIANHLGIQHDGAEAVSTTTDVPPVVAIVQPQTWHRDQAVDAGDAFPVDVSREVAALSDDERAAITDNSDRSDALYLSAADAGRASRWPGPFYVTVRDAIDAAYNSENDDLDADTCAEDGCDNSLDDGQGYDGFCGDRADLREADGVYGHDDEDE